MMTYNIIDTSERNPYSEAKRYTFDEMLEFFKPEYDPDYDNAEEMEKFSEISDVDDLMEFLEWQAQGMDVHFVINKDVEVESKDEIERWNTGIFR